MGFILMYDVTDEESFLAVSSWANQVKTYSWEYTQVVLVGNKNDMEEDRVVTYEQGRKLADALGFCFFECSAKENVNVQEAFDQLVDVICEHLVEQENGVSSVGLTDVLRNDTSSKLVSTNRTCSC